MKRMFASLLVLLICTSCFQGQQRFNYEHATVKIEPIDVGFSSVHVPIWGNSDSLYLISDASGSYFEDIESSQAEHQNMFEKPIKLITHYDLSKQETQATQVFNINQHFVHLPYEKDNITYAVVVNYEEETIMIVEDFFGEYKELTTLESSNLRDFSDFVEINGNLYLYILTLDNELIQYEIKKGSIKEEVIFQLQNNIDSQFQNSYFIKNGSQITLTISSEDRSIFLYNDNLKWKQVEYDQRIIGVIPLGNLYLIQELEFLSSSIGPQTYLFFDKVSQNFYQTDYTYDFSANQTLPLSDNAFLTLHHGYVSLYYLNDKNILVKKDISYQDELLKSMCGVTLDETTFVLCGTESLYKFTLSESE